MISGSKQTKGQVFLKYCWQNQLYQTKDGVSPILSRDLVNIALDLKLVDSEKELTNVNVFYWITDSVVPKWVRLSSFTLALSLGWRPVDRVDVLSVLLLENNSIASAELFERIVEQTMEQYHLRFPTIILKQLRAKF